MVSAFNRVVLSESTSVRFISSLRRASYAGNGNNTVGVGPQHDGSPAAVISAQIISNRSKLTATFSKVLEAIVREDSLSIIF